MAIGTAYKDGQNASYDKYSKFIPKIWTGRLLSNMQGKTILKQYANTEYQGEISGFGDTVSVPAVGRITLGDYAANNTAITYASGDGNELLITVDSAKYWSTRVEDIEKAQAKPEFVNELMKEAAYELAKNTERYLYAVGLTAVAAAHDGMGQVSPGLFLASAAGTAPDADKVYSAFVKVGEVLTDNGAPEEGRFIVVPSFVKSFLLENTKFVGAGADVNNTVKGKGYIGEIDGTAIHVMPRGYFKAPAASHEFSPAGFVDADSYSAGTVVGDFNTGAAGTTADDYKMLFGVKGAIAYVDQLSKTETLRLEGGFANGIRGLHVYGSGVLRPQWLGAMAIDDVDVTDA